MNLVLRCKLKARYSVAADWLQRYCGSLVGHWEDCLWSLCTCKFMITHYHKMKKGGGVIGFDGLNRKNEIIVVI